MTARAQPAAMVEAIGGTIVFAGQTNQQSAASFLRLLQDPGIRRLVITSHGGMVAARHIQAFSPAVRDILESFELERGLDPTALAVARFCT